MEYRQSRSLSRFFILLLAATSLARVLLSVFTTFSASGGEEFFSLELARNIRHGSFTVYGAQVSAFQALYAILLSPFYLFSDSTLRNPLISVFNALLLSSSLIPGYLLARRILKKPWQIMLSLLLLALSPNLLLSLTDLSENLYIPLLLWGFYLAYRLFSAEEIRPLHAGFFGLFTFLLCFAHSAGAAFAVGAAGCFFAAGKKKSRKEVLLPAGCWLAGLVLPVLLLKLTLFRDACLLQPVIEACNRLLYASDIMYFLYTAFMLFLFFLVSVFWFPAALPLLERKKLTAENRILLLLSGIYVLCVSLGTALGVNLKDEFGRIDTRAFLRSFAGAGFPFVLLSLSCLEGADPAGKKSSLLRLTLAFAALSLLFLRIPCLLGKADAPLFEIARLVDPEQPAWLWVFRALPAVVCAAVLVFWNKKRERALACLLSVMLVFGLFNSVLLAGNLRKDAEASSDPALEEEVSTLDRALSDMDSPVLVVADEASDSLLRALALRMGQRWSLALAPELQAYARERLEQAKESGESLAPMTEIPGDRGTLADYLAPSLLDLAEYKQVVSLADTLPLSLSGWERTEAEGISAETWRAGEGAKLILPDPRSVRPGQKISFSSDNPSFEKYEPTGFSSPEPGFTWADGKEATLTLIPDLGEPDSLYFRLTWLMQIGNQYCQIHANDTLVCEADMLEMGSELEFFVPADAWAEIGALTLRFSFPDAMEPGNGDPRLLSIAFESLELMEE